MTGQGKAYTIMLLHNFCCVAQSGHYFVGQDVLTSLCAITAGTDTNGSVVPDTLVISVFTSLIFLLDTDSHHIVVDMHFDIVLAHARQVRAYLEVALEL